MLNLPSPWKERLKAWRYPLAGLVLIGGFCFTRNYLGNLCYRGVFERSEPNLCRRVRRKNLPVPNYFSRNRPAVNWLKERKLSSTWEIRSRDDLSLKAFYLPAEAPESEETPKRLVILLHGFRGQPEDCSEVAQIYHAMGYHVLLPALRAHSISEGSLISMGWKDRIDLIDWIQSALARLGEETEIVLHGLSLGATTVLMSCGESLPPNVKAAVSDSAFTNLNDILARNLTKVYKVPSFLVLPKIRKRLLKEQGFDLYEASAIKQLQNCRIPLLILHGYQDETVPVSMAYQLSEAGLSSGAAPRELQLFKYADHCQAVHIDAGTYQKILVQFFEEHLEKPQ